MEAQPQFLDLGVGRLHHERISEPPAADRALRARADRIGEPLAGRAWLSRDLGGD